MKNRSTVFTLGNRGNVLTTELENQIIVPHSAQKNETKVFRIFLFFETVVTKCVHFLIYLYTSKQNCLPVDISI